MTRFFTRIKLAFRAFFAILFRDRIPQDIAAALVTTSTASSTTRSAPDVPAGRVRPDERQAAESSAAGPASARHEEPTATQMLAVFQRDGRLVDFLMEDIAAYSDAQIGGAVRTVHAGCRQALQQYVSLAPAFEGQEGARVTVDQRIDAARVKLIGNVGGAPPFTGILNHRGWVVARVELPPLAASGRQVIAPAEIEVS